MDDPADCRKNCAVVAGIVWTVFALLLILTVALFTYGVIVKKRRLPPKRREKRPPLDTSQVKNDVAAEKLNVDQHQTQGLADADPSRMCEIGSEIAALSTLSSEYRVISSKRRYLSRKIICNTVAEVSRRHLDLKITAVFSGSTQEGLGDTLQPIQYFQTSSEKNCVDDIEGVPCDSYAKRPMFSSDLDVMVVPLAVCVGPNGDLEYEHIQSKPLSFVKLKPTAGGKLGNLGHCLTKSGHLSARAVKNLFHNALSDAKLLYCGPSVLVSVQEHGAAVEMQWAEPSVDGEFCETVLIADFTFALRIHDWPGCAVCWIERKRNWPSRHLTAAVAAGGCHAVAFYRDSSDDECQWRLSFSRAELILFSALPPYARDMCIALKALFKSRIQPHCPSLSSYHLKTIVLWIVEHAPSDLFSSSDSAAAALLKSLALLLHNVRDGRMPHYFVAGHNIFPPLSNCEVKAATDAILDAALYAGLHLTRLRTSEAKYLNAKDYLLVRLPGERIKTKSKVQIVIQRQLNRILDAIPDASEVVPIRVPRKPVLVHLLTGRVVKLSFEEVTSAPCLSAYDEIVTAVVQENANQMKGTAWGCIVASSFKTSFAHEFIQGLVFDTEKSLENARRYAKIVKKYYIVLTWAIVALCGLAGVLTGGLIVTIEHCACSRAPNNTEYSRTDSSGSGISQSRGNDRPFNAVYSNGLGVASHFALVGAIRGSNRVLDNVNYQLPSYSNRIRG